MAVSSPSAGGGQAPALREKVMEKLVSLCKRRGLVFPSSEIYGGIGSCWDYGPYGVELKRNVKEHWWRSMTLCRDDIEGIDAAILMHPRVWEASGHVAGFSDPLADCRTCKKRFREDEIRRKEGKPPQCPHCGSSDLGEVRPFNLMFKTFMGPIEDSAAVVYLRPETAQGIYVNFHGVRETARRKLPFGIAQIGKAFRNEITPGNFIFRTREFEQMEMQFFVKPGDDERWMEEWRHERMRWYVDLGVSKERLRFHQHVEKELAHYAKAAYDLEYEFPFGWQEIEGIHNRTDFDLRRHQEYSGKDQSTFDEETRERFIPYIIETSAGADRTVLTLLVDAYDEEEDRTVLRLNPKVAPIKAGIFPLVKKDGMPEIARRIHADLTRRFKVFYDESGAVGRRYYRQDELGTPYCVTVDSDTLKDETVTVRERDSKRQERVKIAALPDMLSKALEGAASAS